jgi:hypothetical protein
VALLSELVIAETYHCIPAIKHVNTVRNKLSHRVDFTIGDDDLLPLVQYIEKTTDTKHPQPYDHKEILEKFTSEVCSLFAGYVAGMAHSTGFSK